MVFQQKNFNYEFHYLLINIIILLYSIESKTIKLSLINNESIIKITVANIGINYFLSTNYAGPKPSMSIQYLSFCDINSFYCNINKDNKQIILEFDENRKTHSCENMFKDLVNISEIDLSYFDTSQVTNMASMFKGCSNLTKITFGSMDTSNVMYMQNFLSGCIKLKSVDVSNFDTSNVINMTYMFSSLHSLESLNLDNFNTSRVIDMYGMFSSTKKLTFMNLSMFDTSKIINMTSMFYNMEKLKYLNISNFESQNLISISSMFSGCKDLHYLDIKKFKLNSSTSKFSTFNDIKNLKFCIDDTSTLNYLSELDKNYNICSSTCMKDSNKFIDKVNNMCVQTCGKYNSIFCDENINKMTNTNKNIGQENIYDEGEIRDSINKINISEGNKDCFERCEYCHGPGNKDNNNCSKCKSGYVLLNNKKDIYNCYEICPSYYYFNESNKYTCTEKCPENYNKIILTKKKCVNNCQDDNLVEFNGTCLKNCPKGTYNFENICKYNNTYNEKFDSNDIMTINFQEGITDGSFDEVINDIITEEKDYSISNDNIMYQISTSNNQKISKKNISTIDIGECEIILKEKNDIDMSLPLIIFKRDYFIQDTLIPIIEYEVYDPISKSKLDLSDCDNTVNLNIPVKIDEDELYKYNPNDDYYKDECSSYTTDNGTDILIFDRKKEYSDKNFSLCEANCTYKGYDKINKQSICDCKIKTNIEYISNITNNPNILSQDFNVNENDLGYTNIFACTKNLFTVNGILLNMSSYILLFSLLYFAATSFFFKRRGYRILMNHINNIINGEMKSKSHHKKHKKNSDKMDKYKIMSLNKKIINFPPKKSDNIFSIDNNNRDKKKKLKRNKTKKDAPIKILDDSTKKRIKSVDNSIKKNIPDFEMNSFDYSVAVTYDNRTCFQFYISLLKVKQLFIFAFCPNDDYNSRLIKIGIFILSFNIHYATNFVYFLNEKIIHKIFEDSGKYDIMYFLPFIAITFGLSHIITIFIKIIFLSDSNIIEIKKQKKLGHGYEAISSIRRKLVIKYIMFYIIGIVFHLFFWYCLSSFSTVYTNTQVFVLENALLAFGISMIYPFIFNIIPSALRICSLGSKKNHNTMYNISKFLQML